jgi:hypothetical protein
MISLRHTFCRLSFTRILIGYVYKFYKLRSVAHSLFKQLETLCGFIDLKYFCNIFTPLLISECNFCHWSQKSRFIKWLPNVVPNFSICQHLTAVSAPHWTVNLRRMAISVAIETQDVATDTSACDTALRRSDVKSALCEPEQT